MVTPAELYTKVVGVVKEGEEYNQTLIYETLGLRFGEEDVVGGAAPITVTLDQPYATGVTDYVIWRQVKTSDDEAIDVVIVPGSQTETSFQVWAPKTCTFKYITTHPTITIVP